MDSTEDRPDPGDSLTWLAGWFEARGHIVIECREALNKRSGGLMRRDKFGIGICGPDRLVDFLKAKYGGRVYSKKFSMRDWRTHSADAARLLMDLKPHLRFRMDEADHALQFWATMGLGRRGVSIGGQVLKMRQTAASAFWASRIRRPKYAENRRRAKLLRKASGDT